MIHAALRSSNRRRERNEEGEVRRIRPDSCYSAKQSANLAVLQRLNRVHSGKSCE